MAILNVAVGDEDRGATFAELVASAVKLLAEHPDVGSWEVLLEGCDCTGNCRGIQIDSHYKWVTFKRSEGAGS